MSENNQYDPNTIIQNANEIYAQNNKNLEEAQMCYQSALLDWVDDAREMENNGQDVSTMKDAIATLWIEYARLNSNANMVCYYCVCFEQDQVRCLITQHIYTKKYECSILFSFAICMYYNSSKQQQKHMNKQPIVQ